MVASCRAVDVQCGGICLCQPPRLLLQRRVQTLTHLTPRLSIGVGRVGVERTPSLRVCIERGAAGGSCEGGLAREEPLGAPIGASVVHRDQLDPHRLLR